MGIETIALIGLAASAASAGVEYKASRDAAADSKDAERKKEAAIRGQNQKLADAQAANDATMAARSARARQRALLAGQGNSETIATSPLGLAQGTSGNAPTVGGGQKTLGQ